MPFIKTIEPGKATGDLKEIYENLATTRGKIAEIHKIQSLNPEGLTAHMDLYMCIMFGKSPLKRYQREMMGVVVSATNNCTYCINHHEQALLAYWKDEEKTKLLIDDRKTLSLSDEDRILCDFSELLTKNSLSSYQAEVQKLMDIGLTDRSILDAVQVIAYFNFVNRMVLGLGVTFTEEEMKGYNY
jgi:uncharacterized peroxidase-related enzyme